MEATISAQKGQRNGKVGSLTGQTPLEFFEQHARTVWHSDLAPQDKANKLFSIRSTIQRYIQRSNDEVAARVPSQSAWERLAYTRAVSYLDGLAKDILSLAMECQERPAKEA